jgi:fido (protein-threonine AMPylation protein)
LVEHFIRNEGVPGSSPGVGSLATQKTELDNRFARRLEELDPEERQLAEAAVRAAQSSFAGFKEKPDSEYHRAPNLSPEATWTRVAEELGRVAALTTLEGYRDHWLEVADIELIHRGIFEPVFGEKTLSFRNLRKHGVTFPIVTGTQEEPHAGVRRGTGGKQVKQNLREALDAFERDVEGLEAAARPPIDDAARAAVKLYTKVIGIHPFFDGNGRTAWAVVSYALQRCGLVEIAVPPSDQTRWALGRALRQDGSQSYEPLTKLVVAAIRNSV